MNILDNEIRPEAVQITFDDLAMFVLLRDNRKIRVTINSFPRLQDATQAQRENFRLIGRGRGINWPDLDEDISIAGLLQDSIDLDKLAAK